MAYRRGASGDHIQTPETGVHVCDRWRTAFRIGALRHHKAKGQGLIPGLPFTSSVIPPLDEPLDSLGDSNPDAAYFLSFKTLDDVSCSGGCKRLFLSAVRA